MSDATPALPADVKGLVEFARWAIRESAWKASWLEGADVREKAEELGLIVKEQYDPAKHGPNDSDVLPGDDWYVFATALESLASRAEGEWRSIDSAPLDNTNVLISGLRSDGSRYIYVSRFVTGVGEGWIIGEDWVANNVTHWQPLPAPPAREGGAS